MFGNWKNCVSVISCERTIQREKCERNIEWEMEASAWVFINFVWKSGKMTAKEMQLICEKDFWASCSPVCVRSLPLFHQRKQLKWGRLSCALFLKRKPNECKHMLRKYDREEETKDERKSHLNTGKKKISNEIFIIHINVWVCACSDSLF